MVIPAFTEEAVIEWSLLRAPDKTVAVQQVIVLDDRTGAVKVRVQRQHLDSPIILVQ